MKWRRMITYITVLFFLLCFARKTKADDGNVINISLKDLGTPMENVRFELHKVGSLSENQPVIDSCFHIAAFSDKAYSLDYTARKISEMLTVKPKQSGTTDAAGFLSFDGLESGVYLIRMSKENPYGTISPFLVFLPCFENGAEIHSIVIEPKASPPDSLPNKEIPAASTDMVKTGDFTPIKPYIILAVLSLIVCAVLIPEAKVKKGVKS